jgi:hypothetical protein
MTQFINLLGYQQFNAPFMPYELPFYFQLPEEDAGEEVFDITKAFSPTLYRMQKD